MREEKGHFTQMMKLSPTKVIGYSLFGDKGRDAELSERTALKAFLQSGNY